MRPSQERVLLVLLVSCFLFCDAALNYMDLPIGNSHSGRYVFLVWIGILFAQPALLAIWAAFGTEPLFVRLPRAVVLLSLVSLAVTFGTWLNLAGRLDEDSFGVIVSLSCQFSLALLILWLPKRFREWRIVGARSVDGRRSEIDKSFSLTRLMAWHTVFAVVLVAGLILFSDSWMEGGQGLPFEVFRDGAVAGLAYCFFTSPVVFLLFGTLGRQRNLWHVLACLLSASLLFGVALIGFYLVDGKLVAGDIKDLLIGFVSFYIASFVALSFMRVMGYRLRHSVGDGAAPTVVDSLCKGGTPNCRFALVIAALLLLLLAMCPSAIELHELRVARFEDQSWLNLGVSANLSSDGNFSSVSFLVDRPIQDDAFRMLTDCTQLASVNLGSSKILDRHLELVGKLERLEVLNLSNTRVTDVGRQHLKSLQELRFLYLQTCPQITTAGVRELRVALPECRIVFP